MKKQVKRDSIKTSIAIEKQKKIKEEKYIDQESPIDNLPYPDYPFNDHEELTVEDMEEISAEENGFFRDDTVQFAL